jgi:uncharacterized protein (DUF1697 family)
MKYVALLRGINVGGNNKVSMADLKEALSEAGLTNVRTYINSGNVLFESQIKDEAKLAEVCEKAIEKKFGFPVGCAVLSEKSYKKEIDAAPSWWGKIDPNIRSDALFVLRHGTAEMVVSAVGDINNEYEWLATGDSVIFWTVDRRKYTKARLPKIIGSDAYRTFSMRSSTTTRKLYALLDD